MPDQYVIELDVFHQLHCLNAIRKTLFPERYWADFDDYYTEDGRRNYTSTAAKHYGKDVPLFFRFVLAVFSVTHDAYYYTLTDHCLDSIRQSIMCHGDVATVYWQWMPVRRQPLPRLEITHTCRDFEAIKEWAKNHRLKGDETILQWRPAPIETFQLSGKDEDYIY
jgi:hypothetical protein